MVGILGRHSKREPHGHYILTCLDGGPPLELDTFQCAHCGGHFIFGEIGPGDKRRLGLTGLKAQQVKRLETPHKGYCQTCAGHTCGKCFRDHSEAHAGGLMPSVLESSGICRG